MQINGCLMSDDSVDKVLVKAELDPHACRLLLMDKSKKPLVTIWYEIRDGQVWLFLHWMTRLNQPIVGIPITFL